MVCCDLHRAEGCCDPEDCGPCCENCPTCPTLQGQKEATVEAESFSGRSILELMGHRRLAGFVSTESIGGARFLRIDVPLTTDGETTTQFYAPSAVHCLTPTTEQIACGFAEKNRPAPVSRYELAPIVVHEHEPDDCDEEDDQDGAF